MTQREKLMPPPVGGFRNEIDRLRWQDRNSRIASPPPPDSGAVFYRGGWNPKPDMPPNIDIGPHRLTPTETFAGWMICGHITGAIIAAAIYLTVHPR